VEGGFFMDKKLKMDCDEAIEYVKNNVKTYDILELSYNRIFTPGEVLNITTECLQGRDVCHVMVQLTGDTVNSTVEVDLEEVKDDLIEVIHKPKDEDSTTTITIERCDM
jgi:hypothetical protein